MKNDQPPEIEVLTVEDSPATSKLLAALEANGMTWKRCRCGQPFLTRRESNLCPPCEHPERFGHLRGGPFE